MSDHLKVTAPMINMLKNAQEGRKLTDGLVGRSQHGGSEWTLMALRRRGLLKINTITQAGIEALEKAGKK